MAALAVLLAALWSMDAWLWFRLRMIATEAHSRDPMPPTLTIDFIEELDGYEPRRLANFIHSSSKQIRTTSCLSLSESRSLNEPAHWEGAFLKLFEAFRKGEDYLSVGVAPAMRNVPKLTRADAEVIFAYAEELLKDKNARFDYCGELLEKVAQSLGETKPKVVEALFRSMNGSHSVDRKSTMERLLRLAPNSPEARNAVRIVVRSEPLSGMNTSPALDRLRKEPELIDELIVGDEKQRQFAVLFAAQEIEGGPQGVPVKNTSPPKWLTPERLDQLVIEARRQCTKIKRETFSEHWAALDFVGRSKDGPEWLFDLARRSSDLLRADAIRAANRGALRRPPTQVAQFFEPRLNELLEYLNDSHLAVQQAAFDTLTSTRENGWERKHRTGVDSSIIVALRKAIPKSEFRDSSSWLPLFFEASPEIDRRDVELIASSLKRRLERTEAAFKKSKAWTGLHESDLEALSRLQKHADHTAARLVLELRRKLEAEGVIRTKKEQPSPAKIDE